jgi:hypothetical protein
MLTFINIILLISFAALTFALIFQKKLIKSYQKEIQISNNLIENLNKKVELLNEWHDNTRRYASILILSEACLSKALEDFNTNQDNKGLLYAERWLEKRADMLEELRLECDEQGNCNLEEIYSSCLRISGMIYSGELDIDRN